MHVARLTFAAVLSFGPLSSGVLAQSIPTSMRTPLAPGEVELTVASKGASVYPADKATTTFNLRCPGATIEEATAKVNAVADGLTKELVARGIPRQNIVVDEPSARLGFVGNEAITADLPPEMQQAIAKQPRYATLTVKVVVTDMSLLRGLREVTAKNGLVSLENTDYELNDDRAARRSAIADAVRRANADAEAYASSLGLRVARTIRVTDQAANPSIMGNYSELMERMILRKNVASGKVETSVNVAVDFVLRPQ